MTIEEFLSKPVGMTFEVYEVKLDELHKLQKKCKSILNNVVCEADSMSVFDDHSDPRYIKHKELHEKYYIQFTQYMNKIENLKQQLKG